MRQAEYENSLNPLTQGMLIVEIRLRRTHTLPVPQPTGAHHRDWAGLRTGSPASGGIHLSPPAIRTEPSLVSLDSSTRLPSFSAMSVSIQVPEDNLSQGSIKHTMPNTPNLIARGRYTMQGHPRSRGPVVGLDISAVKELSRRYLSQCSR